MKDTFPFSAVVGQDEAQLALLLAAIDPAIGGVLLRGEKGSAKSTLARGLAALLPDGAPFVELPIGATEDRVLGSLDLRAALDGDSSFRPGLLAAANGGVLYVDEVNLLPDHLVDALLDAAASGVNRVERDGVSHEHAARFVLLGSMNPEEGELRPQLLDRFGLSVEVTTPRDPSLRAEAVRRRLAHDSGVAAAGNDEELRWRLASSRPGALSDAVLEFAARLAVEVGAESLRADLVLCRAAAALAGWEGHSDTTTDDVVRVAGLALGHRRRRRPFDPPTMSPEDLAAAVDSATTDAHRPPNSPSSPSGGDSSPPLSGANSAPLSPSSASGADSPLSSASSGANSPMPGPPSASSDTDSSRPEPPSSSAADSSPSGSDPSQPKPPPSSSGADPSLPSPGSSSAAGSSRLGPSSSGAGSSQSTRPSASSAGADASPSVPWESLAGGALAQSASPLAATAGRRAVVEGRGRAIGDRRPSADGPQGVAVLATARAALQRRLADPAGAALTADDVREPRRAARQPRTVVLCVDTSGSMGTRERVTAATGAVLGLLADAYLQRDQVALVAFRDGTAVEVLPPTGSVELARARLADLPTGGHTPLAEGITAALSCAQRTAAKGAKPLLVLLTDGRATGSPAALDHAHEAAEAVAAAGIEALVLDAEPPGPTALELAAQLAASMNARYLPLPGPTGEAVESTIRHAVATT